MTRWQSDPAPFLRGLFDAAVAAASPAGKFATLPEPPRGRTIVVGAGKAAASMAAAFEQAWDAAGHAPAHGLVVTRDGHGAPTEHVEVVEASHPVPDARGVEAARRILALAHSAGENDLVIALVSGGASALLSLPADGVTVEEKRELTHALLRSGAPIGEINTVRRALSAIKGGRLLRAAQPAPVITYLISDVPGDDPGTIGSGPTIPSTTTADDAIGIAFRRGIALEPHLAEAMRRNAVPPTPPGPVHMIATPQGALDATARAACEAEIDAHILGADIEGEARDVGTVLAGIAAQVARRGQPFGAPCVLLSGGETTVTVRTGEGDGTGRGGRNSELALAFALALEAMPDIAHRIHLIAGDTDGVDGVDEHAAVLVSPTTLDRARKGGVDPAAALHAHDSLAVFRVSDEAVVTGPTRTNVNDFRAVLII